MGNVSPSLFVTVDRFDGYPQKLGHFFLGFSEFGPDSFEFVVFHNVDTR